MESPWEGRHLWSLRDGSLGKCRVRMWCAQVPARGSISMRMPHHESLQATHRSPLVPPNPSRQNIWPPGLRVVGSVTRRMPAWSRSAPEPHCRAPKDTERLNSSSVFCPEPTHISVRTQGPRGVAAEAK